MERKIIGKMFLIMLSTSMIGLGCTSQEPEPEDNGGTTPPPWTTVTPRNTPVPTASTPGGYKNPDNYTNQTTVAVLSANVVDRTRLTSEFRGLLSNCTRVAYAYADPAENANAGYNRSTAGASSFAAYIFGYDNTPEVKFLNAKKCVPYILNKLYYDSKYRNTWYKTLVSRNGIYIILENDRNMGGVKFGNPTDGFGMRIGAGSMYNFDAGSRHVLFHEMSHCIWDTSGTTNNFYIGVDPRTNINYGTGNLITLFNKLYGDSIKSNTFYRGSYGWDFSHENFAETAGRFFSSAFRTQLKEKDPVVYNIMDQIYTKFNF